VEELLSHLLSVHGVNDVWLIKIHSTEPLVTDHAWFKTHTAIEISRRNKSPSIDQILAELI
jgi:hypothetical protein